MTTHYPEGVTASDHIAHDMRMKRFPQQSSVEQFLSERKAQQDAAEALGAWATDGPKLAKAAGCYVEIKISAAREADPS